MVCYVSNKNPWIIDPELHVLFVEILSIRVAVFAVTLVARVINGKGMLLFIKSNKCPVGLWVSESKRLMS